MHACYAAILVSLTGVTSEQSIITQLGWSGPTWSALILLLLLLTTILLIFVVVGLTRSRREVVVTRQAAERLFEESSARCSLSDGEKTEIRRLLTWEPNVQPHAIFQSVSLFERCIDEEIRHLLAEETDDDVRQASIARFGNIRKKLGYAVLPLEHPLVSTRNISLGQIGSLFKADSRTPSIQRAVVTGNDDLHLRIQYDTEKEEPVRFSIGDQARYAFARQNDGFYGILMTIAENGDSGAITFWHTLDLKRNQLRQYVRVDLSIPVRVRMVKPVSPDKSELKRGQAIDAKTGDVSGGGLCFLHTIPLKPGDVVSLAFSLADHQFTGIMGKILRIGLQEGKTSTQYRHHVEYLNIELKNREQVVKFVFDRQRQLNQWR